MEIKRNKQIKKLVNDATGENDKAGDNEVEECARVLGELKPVLGYQETLVSIRLPQTGVSLRLPGYSG